MIRFLFLVCTLFISLSYAQEKREYSVYFETAEYTLTPDEESSFNDFVDKLDFKKITHISIYGYTDDVGSTGYNKKLSVDRATYIQEYLIEKGIDKKNFNTVKGKGEILLKSAGEIETDIERGFNRKVLIEVSLKRTEEEINKRSITYKFEQDLKVGDVITLENLLFKEGYAKIKPHSYTHLRALAKALKERKDIFFEIRGHVCCTRFGRDAIDRKTKKRNLSTARAKYVYDFLAKNKISKHRMRYKGMRRKFPLGKGEQFDRRVEIVIVNFAQKRNVREKKK
ncbi:MAG: OmpA family protein [Flavobacteriaceae bacterium]|nr:OmpA family protein [Flavobacteriaceae bacterium]